MSDWKNWALDGRYRMQRFIHIGFKDLEDMVGYKANGYAYSPEERAMKIDYLIEKNRRILKDMPIGDTQPIYGQLDHNSEFRGEANMIRDVTNRVIQEEFPDRKYSYFSTCYGTPGIDNGDPYASGCDLHAKRDK